MIAKEFLDLWTSLNIKPVAHAARREEEDRLGDRCVNDANLLGITKEQLETVAMMDIKSYVGERIEAANWELMDDVLTCRK